MGNLLGLGGVCSQGRYEIQDQTKCEETEVNVWAKQVNCNACEPVHRWHEGKCYGKWYASESALIQAEEATGLTASHRRLGVKRERELAEDTGEEAKQRERIRTAARRLCVAKEAKAQAERAQRRADNAANAVATQTQRCVVQ